MQRRQERQKQGIIVLSQRLLALLIGFPCVFAFKICSEPLRDANIFRAHDKAMRTLQANGAIEKYQAATRLGFPFGFLWLLVTIVLPRLKLPQPVIEFYLLLPVQISADHGREAELLQY